VSVQPTIAVLATLDTKGPEAAYIRDRLLERGLAALVIGLRHPRAAAGRGAGRVER
jgi:uncharacterized protein (UPF0261 family)